MKVINVIELDDTEESFINIIINPEFKMNLLNNILNNILKMFNNLIGAKSDLNYHILPVENNTIKIPIFKYNTTETILSKQDLISNKIDSIQKLFEKYDFSKENSIYMWFFRSIYINYSNTKSEKIKIDNNLNSKIHNFFEKLFIIKYDDEQSYLHLNINNLEFPKVEEIKFIDGSIIYEYIDPYMIDYGLFCNYSQKLEELNYMYNGLHLFEHLLTHAWDNLESNNILYLNGSTFTNAICNIMIITSDETTLKKYTTSSIKFHIDGRKNDFWNNTNLENIKLETSRTTSETLTERILCSTGRFDPSAFKTNYSTKPFQYWCTSPFNFLITTPKKITFNEQNINKYISSIKFNVKKPKIEIFNHYPYEVLYAHKVYNDYLLKKDSKKIANNILNKKKTTAFYGVDCKLKADMDLSTLMNFLFPLLYTRKFITNEQINEYVTNTVLPYNSLLFNDTSFSSLNYKTYYLKKYIED